MQAEGFEFFENANAFWRAKKDKTNVTFFKTGSVLIQAGDAERDRIAAIFGGSTDTSKPVAQIDDRTIVGLDESGKGDYFGPLTLAAAALTPEATRELSKLGVADSKTLTPQKIRDLYPQILSTARIEVCLITPDEYNRLYSHFQNLGDLMFDRYRSLIERFEITQYDSIILDRFSASDDKNRRFSQSLPKPIRILPKGEQFTPVAAASIVARFRFVEWMEQASERLGFRLPLGCGSEAGALFHRLKTELPDGEFKEIAKAHFGSKGSLF